MLIFANYLALNRKYISASSYSFEMFLPGPKRWTVWPDWQTDVDVHRAMLLLWRQKSLNSVDACDSSLENSHLKILKPCSMNPTLNLKQCGPARLRWMLMRLVLHSFDWSCAVLRTLRQRAANRRWFAEILYGTELRERRGLLGEMSFNVFLPFSRHKTSIQVENWVRDSGGVMVLIWKNTS